MAPCTASNLHQRATAGVMAPRTASNLQHRAAAGVVAPRTASNLHQRATAGTVAPRSTKNLHQRAPADARGEPPKTSSYSCSFLVVDSATATHDFVVTEYSKVKTLGVGQYVSSDAFSAGGHDWKIRLYPKLEQAQGRSRIAGYRRSFPWGASLHLCDDADADEDTKLTVRFTLSVLHPGGRVSPMASQTTTAISGAPPPHQRHGFTVLFDGSRLRPWRCVNNDAVTIRCRLTVVELTTDPARLLDTGAGEDVTFQVRGRAFPAHRFILAGRSPVFGDMMEKDAPCIKIVGIRPEVFELLLRFIYTDALPGDGEGCDAATMQQLLVAADLYGFDKLKHICELKLHAR